jgi:hypothetical protein
MAHEEIGEVNQPAGDATGIHQGAGQNEKWHSQQGKGVGPLEHHVGNEKHGGISQLD